MTLTVAPAVRIYDVNFHSHMFVREAALTHPHIDLPDGVNHFLCSELWKPKLTERLVTRPRLRGN